jgi:hypothetical protein
MLWNPADNGGEMVSEGRIVYLCGFVRSSMARANEEMAKEVGRGMSYNCIANLRFFALQYNGEAV